MKGYAQAAHTLFSPRAGPNAAQGFFVLTSPTAKSPDFFAF